MNFGIAPSKTVPLQLLPHSASRNVEHRDRLRIDLSELPWDQSGVYVLRFVDRVFSRLRGESSVLKIGSATKSFADRFSAYNGKCEATTFPGGLAELTRDYCTNAKTDFQFMWLLPKLQELGPMVLDLYYSDQGRVLETDFLLRCLDHHWDMPPLNRGLA